LLVQKCACDELAIYIKHRHFLCLDHHDR
jgi:hypothetical protein